MADTTPPAAAPVEEDIRFDDEEFNPALEPKKSKAWLNLLQESEDAFEKWNDHCDKIDKLYASLERLSNMSRDKEFQMFWANIEVLKPAIYATPPVPAVASKFHDRRPVVDAAAEMLERCCIVAFDLTRIQELMLLVRDDVALIGRGVPWCRYESGGKNSYYDTERVCIDYKNRRDFLHSVSRNWREVTWVAAASYLTRAEARKRFKKYSGNAYQEAEYRVDKNAQEVGGADNRERAAFWEIWSKTDRRVVWVAKGVEVILDEDDPHLDLSDYFPCPQPAYGTTQRNSLVPVPDVMQYRDQLDELNELTGRIHALSSALEAKGFYPAGSNELSDAVQAAVAMKTSGRVLVPISNWAAFGGTKDVIIWLPIDMIAQTITQCVTLRQQIIQDIYQIIGLSDIMRGATDARETLGAQQLKSEYGSSRVRDKQEELVRLARDLVCIISEIMTDKFDPVTLIEMSQTQLPTRAMVEQEATQLQAQLAQQQQMLQQAQQAMQQPQAQQALQQNPQAAQMLQQAQQVIQTGQDTLKKIMAKPTVDQVLKFLRDNRSRSFVLDIETDSTIQVDENNEKQRRSEFVGVLAQLLPQLTQMIQLAPQTASFCGEVLKFATAPFRAGRSLDSAIDDLVDLMMQQGNQPQGPDPTTMQNQTALQIEQMKDQREREKNQQDAALQTAELQLKDKHAQMKIQSDQQIALAQLNARKQEDDDKAQGLQLKMIHDREKHQADMLKTSADMQVNAQKAQLAQQAAQNKQIDMAARASERQAAQQFRMMQPQRPPGGGGMPR
jgi:hypothetical protein